MGCDRNLVPKPLWRLRRREKLMPAKKKTAPINRSHCGGLEEEKS
jgi:hypothetical protein